MRPDRQDIAVPPFPPGTEWVGAPPDPVDRVCARGPLAVELIDAAHPSSVRTLPYLQAWADRYGALGLTVLGVNSPRFPFTSDPAKLAAALERSAVRFPVAVDRDYAIWHDYGAKGWPSLFLWGRGGALRWFHFGEGEYQATEEAIQAELRAAHAGEELPPPLGPLRPFESPGAMVAPPSEEVFPGGSEREPWRPADDDSRLELEYAAGGAWVTVDGTGSLAFSLDGGPERSVEIARPGAYPLVEHDHHETHLLALRPSRGIELYAVAFSPGLPDARR